MKILVWKTSEATGDPDFEVRIPARLAKWVPRMMAFVPKRARSEVWGEDTDFAMFANIEQLISEAAETGLNEVADVRTKDTHVKVFVEKEAS